MSLLDDDLAAIHSDALALGMADSATYTQGSTSKSITVTFIDLPAPFLHDQGGEVERSDAAVSIAVSDITAPAKGDTFTVSSGTHAGTWTVLDAAQSDSAVWTVNARIDDRKRMGNARRLP